MFCRQEGGHEMNTHGSYKKKVKPYTRLKRRILILAMISIAFFLWIFAGSERVSAQDTDAEQKQKCYKSIEISYGDTLWNIAEKYMNNDYDSVQAYMKELKEINGLSGDKIYEGKYLMVPYYN